MEISENQCDLQKPLNFFLQISQIDTDQVLKYAFI